ncbi:MAG: MoaD/ThiS family protein [Fuerstiella sp.]
MPRVVLTSNLKRHVECTDSVVAGETVRQVLDAVFQQQAGLRGYVLNEHGQLRTHMAVFLDGRPVKDRQHLSDPVNGESEVYIMQALSGG